MKVYVGWTDPALVPFRKEVERALKRASHTQTLGNTLLNRGGGPDKVANAADAGRLMQRAMNDCDIAVILPAQSESRKTGSGMHHAELEVRAALEAGIPAVVMVRVDAEPEWLLLPPLRDQLATSSTTQIVSYGDVDSFLAQIQSIVTQLDGLGNATQEVAPSREEPPRTVIDEPSGAPTRVTVRSLKASASSKAGTALSPESRNAESGEPPAPATGGVTLGDAAKPKASSDAPITEVERDELAYRDYAQALAALIDNPETTAPLTLLVNAPWGTGKTSLGHLIDAELEATAPAGARTRPHATAWFNAWMHDLSSDINATLTADLVRDIAPQRPLSARVLRPIPLGLLSRREATERLQTLFLLPPMILAFLLVVAFAAQDGSTNSLADAWEVVSGFAPYVYGLAALAIVLPVVQRSIEALSWSMTGLRRFVRGKRAISSKETLEIVREEINEYIDEATRGKARLVLFVDDLDRCSAANALSVLRYINQILTHRNMVVVILADAKRLIESLRVALAIGRIDGGRDAQEVDRFLEKIVQLQFDLPRPAPGALSNFLGATVEDSGRKPGADQQRTVAHRHHWLGGFKRAWEDLALGYLAAEKPTDEIVEDSSPWFRRFFDAPTALARGAFVVSRNAVAPPYARQAHDESVAKHDLRAGFVGLGLVILATLVLSSGAVALVNSGPLSAWRLLSSVLLTTLVLVTIVLFIVNPLFFSAGAVVGALAGLYVRLAWHKETPAPTGPLHLESAVPPNLLARARAARARRQLDTLIQDDSTLFRRALSEYGTFVATTPRGNRRLVNKLRLDLRILLFRNLLAPHGPIKPESVGKIMAIREEFPSFIRVLEDREALFTVLESAAAKGVDEFRGKALEANIPLVGNIDLLVRWLASPPRVGKHYATIQLKQGPGGSTIPSAPPIATNA